MFVSQQTQPVWTGRQRRGRTCRRRQFHDTPGGVRVRNEVYTRTDTRTDTRTYTRTDTCTHT